MARAKKIRKEKDRPKFRGFVHCFDGIDLEALKKITERMEKGEPLFYDNCKPEEVK
jgi:hypothetical protein